MMHANGVDLGGLDAPPAELTVAPAIAPLLADLARIGGPDDTRPEADVLEDLDARAAAVQRVLEERGAEERAGAVASEIERLRLLSIAGPETLGALRDAIGARKKAIGADRPKLPAPAESTIALLSLPPVGHARTDIETLDAITDGGWMSGKFHVIAGEPNVGKTSLAVQMARSALEDGWVVGFHVADVDDRSGILLRIAQAHGLDRRKFLARDPETVRRTSQIVQRWAPRFGIIDEAADEWTIDDSAERLLELGRAQERRAVLFVDSLQTIQLRWPERDAPRTDKDRIDRVVKRLVYWTRKGLTVVATCEIPRGFYTGPKKKPRGGREAPPALAAFKGSGNIEYAAWTALVITRIRGDAEGVRVEVPKNKQGREDVAFRLERTSTRVGYEDAGELHEHVEQDDAPTRKPGDESLGPYLERVRKALAGMPQGFAGGRDDLTKLAGGKAAATRAAIALLITRGELLLERPQGEPPRLRLRRVSDGAAVPSAPIACPACALPKGVGEGLCSPCPTCGDGCRRVMPDAGGCSC